MQEHVRDEGLDYGLFERVGQAAQWLRTVRPAPARVRVVGDDDSDGTTSAFVLRHALARLGYEVTVDLLRVHTTEDVDLAMRGDHDLYIIADCGSAFLEYLDSFSVPVLVLDHHRVLEYEPRNVFEVNPRRLGGDQVDFVSASVVCQVLAACLDPENRATAFAALAGGIADRQHLSGFRGLINHLIDEAEAAGHVTRRQGLTLPGRTVLEAVTDALDPYLDGLTGQPGAATRFLEDLGIDPEEAPRDLPLETAQRLGDALVARLKSKDLVTDRIYPPVGEMLPLEHASGVPTVFALTRLLETLTAEDEFATALNLLAGDAEAAKDAWARHRARVGAIVAETQRMRDHVEERGTFRLAMTKDTSDTGIYAHILLTYVFGDDKPFLAYTRSGRRVRVSARGSPRLFNAGLDLSIGMAEAAEAVGGNGGGHPGASGAAFDAGAFETFLATLDASLARLRKERSG